MTEQRAPIGVIGTGLMGTACAGRLRGAGFDVLAYDVDQAKLARLGETGCRAAGSLAEVARACRKVVLAVFDTGQVEDVIEGKQGLLAVLPAGPTHFVGARRLSAQSLSKRLDKRLDTPPFDKSLWGVSVWDHNGKQVYGRNERRLFTPASLRGSATRARASTSIAFQAVCQSTPRCRARAETVVSSSLSASTAQPTARTVSAARRGATSWASLNVPVQQPGSRQRQIRTSHRTRVTRPKHGASCSTLVRRPWPTASTPQVGQPCSS